MKRTNISSGLKMDSALGASRAVRLDDIVRVGAVGPTGENGETVAPDNIQQQAVRCFDNISAALGAAGSSLGEIVQTRVYTTSRDDWAAVADIHGQLFAEVMPTCTCIIVSQLPVEGWRVQIEVDAIAGADGG